MNQTDQEIENNVSINIKKIIFFLKISKVNIWFLALSVFFSLCFSLTAMYAVQLLYPLVQGIIGGDFAHVQDLGGIAYIARHFPGVFNTSARLFVLLVVWIYLVTIVKNAFQYLASLSSQTQACVATVNLRHLLIEKCLGYGKSFYDRNTISFLQTALTKSTSLMESQFGLFQRAILQFLLLAVYMTGMLSISWKLTCVALIAFPLTGFLTHKIIHKIRNLSIEHDRLTRNLNEKIFNMLYCMPVIKSFTKEKEEIRNFSEASEREIAQDFKTQKITNLAAPVEDVGTMTSILCVAFGLVLVMKVDHFYDPSKAFVFLYLAMRMLPGFGAFNQFKLGSANAASALADIEHILYQDGASIVSGGAGVFTGLAGGIEFKDLSFRYGEKGPDVLNKVNFTIKKREIVAIVGPSGSGKSTLVNLLLRFYDCPPGSIWINGLDIREYDIVSLRKRMAFVSQEVLLFNDTLRNNIVYGASGDVSDQRLHDLGVRMHLNDFIEKMPNKYETSVGERGARLSGGERQRVSIARAVIKDPEILIMDEATSALDSSMEESISVFLGEIAQEKTLIIIAHRLSTIKKADKIIYLDKGRVLESGTFQELIDRKGFFHKQWESQKL